MTPNSKFLAISHRFLRQSARAVRFINKKYMNIRDV